MPTTTNFGWTTPADTDYVKDGALAIRTLGNGIDTSLVDLKGGTTGQILSKASNTDLDYTWINNDQGDITNVGVTAPITGGGSSGSVTIGIDDASTAQKGAVQLEDSTSSTSTTTAATPNSVKSAYDLANGAIAKSLIDAKGDLIVGTADNTVARLAVGATNGHILTVDSSTASGMKWAAAGGGDLVKISSVTWTAANAQSLTSVFSATYDSYMIVFDDMQGTAAANAFSWRLRSGSTNDTNSTYYFANLGLQVDNTASNSNGSATNTFSTSSLVESPHKCGMVLWMFNPYNSVRTSCVWQTFGNTASNFVYRTGGGIFAANTSFDGLGFFLSGGGDISGNVTVYGLKK